MNFYKRFVGDIQVKTGHLTPAEFGIYDRLLDHYYATESRLPDFERCCAIARAMTKSEKQAAKRVLLEFFCLENDGFYSQKRAEEMIAEAQPKIAAARANGARGGRPRRTQPEPIGFETETQGLTQTVDLAKASQNQSSSIATLKKKRGDTPLKPPAWSPPDWVPAKEWADFETSRKAMRGVPFTEAARDGVVRELAKFRGMGADPAQMLTAAVTNGWRTVYPPRAAGTNGSHVNKQEALEASNRAVGDRWLAEQEEFNASH